MLQEAGPQQPCRAATPTHPELRGRDPLGIEQIQQGRLPCTSAGATLPSALEWVAPRISGWRPSAALTSGAGVTELLTRAQSHRPKNVVVSGTFHWSPTAASNRQGAPSGDQKEFRILTRSPRYPGRTLTAGVASREHRPWLFQMLRAQGLLLGRGGHGRAWEGQAGRGSGDPQIRALRRGGTRR